MSNPTKKCPYCFSEIDGRATVCPQCRRNIKPAKKRMSILTALGVLALFCCGLFAVLALIYTPSPSEQSPLTAAAGDGCKSLPDRVVCAGDVATHASFEDGEGETIGAPAGMQFLTVAVQVENLTGRILRISSQRVTLQAGDGREYEPDGELTAAFWGEYGTLDLDPGAKAAVGVLFVLPDGLAPAAVVYDGAVIPLTSSLPESR